MGPVATLILNDVREVRRDRVLSATVALSLAGTLIITVLGAFRGQLPGWADWFPFMVALSLLGGPGGFGFLFGALMVDEGDTGVRDALAVTPVPTGLFLMVRTAVVTSWMAAWPLVSVYLMNATWQAMDLSLGAWLAVILPLALLTPSFALLIPTLARDKVGALSVFKGLTFLALAPLALFLVPDGAPYRHLFLLAPTGAVVTAYQAFLRELPVQGLAWSLVGLVYAGGLLAIVVRRFRMKVYRSHS